MKEIKIYYHDNLKDIIKSKGNLDENGNTMEGLGHIGGKKKSVCIDLYCAQDITIGAGEFAYINLGVSMKLPEGYKADIVPRSGTFGKYNLLQTNSDGRIDTNYSSKADIWKMPVHNVLTQTDIKDIFKQIFIKGLTINYDGETAIEDINKLIESLEFREVTIKAGERVCQMEIYEVMDDFKFIEDNLEGEEIRNGFGNGTGK